MRNENIDHFESDLMPFSRLTDEYLHTHPVPFLYKRIFRNFSKSLMQQCFSGKQEASNFILFYGGDTY